MWRLALSALALLTISLADGPRAAEDANSKVCPAPEGKLELRPEDATTWSPCEKWVWSCILQGKEANLYEKKCFVPRSKENTEARAKSQYEPFVNPDAHDANLLGDEFLRTILWQEDYAKKIPPPGVRIYGAYFRDPVNLENVATSANLVIDGSMFKKGVRLTNFRSPKNISFDGSNIRGPILMLRTRIDGSLFLQKGVYDTVDLRDARIGSSIDAARSVFTDDFRMDRARIEGKVNLVKSRLTVMNAWDAAIGGSLELRLADIRLRVDMTGATVNGDVRMQRIAFGRKRAGQVPSCDWDPTAGGDHLLSDLNAKYASEKEAWQRTITEIVLSRPSPEGRPDIGNICVELLKEARFGANNEVLLRDMKIKGNLCLIDLTGEIASDGGREHLDIISLDGTQANSTVLRWKDSPSETLWHAVNFKTPYMLVNLESQPRQHFIDNMDVGFVAFVKKDPKEPPAEKSDENVDKYLCDVTPAPENAMAAWSDGVHRRLVQFFAGPANKSRSAQPFSRIVERLEESGATSTYLKIKLSEYKLAKVCTTSAVSKELSTFDDLSWLTFPQRLTQAWRKVRESTEIAGDAYDVVGETNRLFWDGVCSSGMMVYRYAVSYGHEPYNLFYYAILFVGVFWLLLKLDKPVAQSDAEAKKLGLTYAVDTFVPLAQLRLDRRNASALPNRRLLRIYLQFHRFTGVVFAVLVFLFIYRAAK
jgi:hypothetical protein